MKIKIFIVSLLLGFSLPTLAQRADKNTQPGFSDGLVYSLPRTGLRITVKAAQEKYFHGPYAAFAENLLGIKDAPQADAENWIITDVQVEPFAEADPNQVYYAKNLNGTMLSLSSMGTILGVNKIVEWQSKPIPVLNYSQHIDIPVVPFPDLSLEPTFQKGDSTQRAVLIKKSLDEKALEAAQTITNLRKHRFESLTNEFNEPLPDGRAYEVMAKELGKLEDDYMALFIGKSYSNTFEYSFDYIPGDNSVSGDVVFRFSDKKGVVPKNDMSGKPIAIDIKKLDELTSAYNREKSSLSAAQSANLFYRVPGVADIRLLNGVSPIAETRAYIAQFGVVVALPDELLDGVHQVLYNPETGGIKAVTGKQ